MRAILLICALLVSLALRSGAPGQAYVDDGPRNQVLLVARSADGRTFQRVPRPLAAGASVPGAVVMPSGEVRLYFVDADTNRLKVATSPDGETFSTPRLVLFQGFSSEVNPVAPDPVLLPGGGVRLYVQLGPQGPGEVVPTLGAADSKDGVLFSARSLEGLGEDKWFNPAVAVVGGVYRLFAGQGNRLFSLSSRDGLTFERDPVSRLAGASSPSVVSLPGGGIRLYFQRARQIWSAWSRDGVEFQEEGTVLEWGKKGQPDQYGCGNPAVVRLADGSYRLYYNSWVELPPEEQLRPPAQPPRIRMVFEPGDYFGPTDPNPDRRSEFTRRVDPALRQASAGARPEGRFGINGYHSYSPRDAWDLGQLARYFEWESQELASVGLSYNRTLSPAAGQFSRRVVEPDQEGVFDFALPDRLVKAAQRHNLQMVAMLTCNRSGSAIEDHGEPQDTASFRRYVQAVVERYDGDGQADMPGLRYPIRYWQLTTEPEAAFAYDGASYARVMGVTRRAIREADPQALLVSGGARPLYSGTDPGSYHCLRFWRDFLASGGGEVTDVMDLHCSAPEPGADFPVTLAHFQALLARYDYRKPLWILETGTYSGRLFRGELDSSDRSNYPQHSEADQAAWWVQHCAYAFSHGVERLFWNVFYNDGPGWFKAGAMLNRDRSPKLVYYTQRLMAQKIDGFSACRELRPGLVRFQVDSRIVYVAWGSGPLPLEGRVLVTDIYGATRVAEASRVLLSQSPVFVEPAP
jgi:hypothetical protein